MKTIQMVVVVLIVALVASFILDYSFYTSHQPLRLLFNILNEAAQILPAQFSRPFFFSLAGLFVLSLISNATPFFGASYTLIATAELIVFGFTPEGFLLIILITALGAAIGKLIIYGGAEGFSGRLKDNKNVKLLGDWLQHRNFLVVVFIAAVIPLLPFDDYLYIGAGAEKVRLLPMFSVTIIAKIVKSAVEIELELLGILRFTKLIHNFIGLTPLEFSILLSILFIVLGIFFFKFDWELLMRKFSKTQSRFSEPQKLESS
jgi:hypothetical protein